MPSTPERDFRWGVWALLGIFVWIVASLASGNPVLALLAPAAGVILGWLVGGAVYLVSSPFRR